MKNLLRNLLVCSLLSPTFALAQNANPSAPPAPPAPSDSVSNPQPAGNKMPERGMQVS